MAILQVGNGYAYAFTQAGLQSALNAASADDTVRIMQAGTITISSTALYTSARCTLEGDPSLYQNYDPTTLPKLQMSGSVTRGFVPAHNSCSVKNLWFDGFSINSAGNAGGAINGVGTYAINLDNLYFTSCAAAIQNVAGGTHTRIRGYDCTRLYRQGNGMTVRLFWIRQLTGASVAAVDLSAIATTADFALGAVYSTNNVRALNLGNSCPIRNVSAYCAGGAADYAFVGSASHCTAYGYANLVSGINGGNLTSRDPLFTSAVSGTFTFLSSSSEINAGIEITGVSTDLSGNTLPQGAGWPRGPFDYFAGTAWGDFSTGSYINVSGDFVINRNLNLSAQYKKRSGLRPDQNGANAVEQIPFSFAVPGPASLRNRTKPYSITTNPTASNTPSSPGF